jgi:hypothetical protein
MNSDIADIVKWAWSQGWTVVDDSKGYTRFSNPEGVYIASYPATPSNSYRRQRDLAVSLRKAGLPWPPPSKKEQRSERKRGDTK